MAVKRAVMPDPRRLSARSRKPQNQSSEGMGDINGIKKFYVS
jgi:hypothetical protein